MEFAPTFTLTVTLPPFDVMVVLVPGASSAHTTATDSRAAAASAANATARHAIAAMSYGDARRVLPGPGILRYGELCTGIKYYTGASVALGCWKICTDSMASSTASEERRGESLCNLCPEW
jgi:hypothetical protein